MDSKWQEVWKVISDEPVEDRQIHFGEWDKVCEGDVLDEEKAKKSYCDPESESCLDWSKDLKELKEDIWDLLLIQAHPEDDRDAKMIEERKRDADLAAPAEFKLQ